MNIMQRSYTPPRIPVPRFLGPGILINLHCRCYWVGGDRYDRLYTFVCFLVCGFLRIPPWDSPPLHYTIWILFGKSTSSKCAVRSVHSWFSEQRIATRWRFINGQLGATLTVYPWYLLCSLGILGIITHKYSPYRAYIGISHRGTLVGVHPTIPCWYSQNVGLETHVQDESMSV